MVKDAKQYLCPNKHAYDISKEGYVNLLLPNQKNSIKPGDSDESVKARKDFLNKGYYNPLLEKISGIILSISKPISTGYISILDAGCGNGYFVRDLYFNDILRSKSIFYGIDISKPAIKSASKQSSGVIFAVAGIYNIPVRNSSVDILLNIMAPFSAPEFGRILKNNGIIISVIPGQNHLIELKKSLYAEANPYKTDMRRFNSFTVKFEDRVNFTIKLNDNSDILKLIHMTPFYWRSEKRRRENIHGSLLNAAISVDFRILVMEKYII